MKNLTSNQIRNIWIKFFEEKKHLYVTPASLIPVNDDSLLWINSGVATLKNYFNGQEKPPSKRLVNVQKVIRTNDIDLIGKTSRHHTLFEMLGNFSIGDYFKKEAIEMGLELLCSKKYYNIPLNKLYFTVYEEDIDSFNYWIELGIDKDRIIKMGRETNFWDMGNGPCGPSTEIFFDRGKKFDKRDASTLIKEDVENDRFIEIWNIVFSQYDNDGNNNYKDLPQKNIDTGAGLERIASVLQGTPTNFEIDLFIPIIKKIEKLTNTKYLFDYIPHELKINNTRQENINQKIKAIADFARAITIALFDGANFSNEGRGYVLRRILRKAFIYGSELGIQEEFIFNLVDEVVKTMDSFYELPKDKAKIIKQLILREESNFMKILKESWNRFWTKIFMVNWDDNEKVITEEEAFKLHETYGMPLDWLYHGEQISFLLDKNKLKKLNENFQALSKRNGKKDVAMENQLLLFREEKPTKFIGYEKLKSKSKVVAKEKNYIVLDKTPFYATSGGQEFDSGTINGSKVLDVFKNAEGVIIHEIDKDSVKVGQEVVAIVDQVKRKSKMIHHSSVHLLFSALEKVWKTDIPQVGSKVTEDFFRFDFVYQNKPTFDEIKDAVKIVNQWVAKGYKSTIKEMSLKEAKKQGANFLEGTKYGDTVRVVQLRDDVIDLCGGTHVPNINILEEIYVYNFEKKGAETYRIEGVSTKKLIKDKIREENKSFTEKKVEILNKRFNDYFEKVKILKMSNTEGTKIKKTIENLDMGNTNYRVLFDSQIQQIETISKLLDKKIISSVCTDIEGKLQKDNFYIKNLFEIELRKAQKDILNSLNKFEGRLLVLYQTNNEKVTIAFMIEEKLINEDLIEKIRDLTKKYEFRGGGKGQLFIYGGKQDKIDSFLKEIQKWEF